MQNIAFVSSNVGKFLEYQKLLAPFVNLKQVNISLPEEQTEDLQLLCQSKLAFAKKELANERNIQGLFIEDTALYFADWNNFPGPFIKWMLQELGTEKIHRSLQHFSKTAKAVCVISFFHKLPNIDKPNIDKPNAVSSKNKNYYFNGSVTGAIVSPRGKQGFGWDSIFMPNGSKKTFAEMSKAEKNKISHRFLATQQLIKVLKTEFVVAGSLL